MTPLTEDERLRLIETAARDLLPTLESYSDDIDLIDFRAALRVTPVADTAGIDAARLARIVAALSAAEPQLREVWNQHSGAMGYVFDCTCDLCALLWVASAEPEAWQRRLDERATALRTPKPEGEPE